MAAPKPTIPAAQPAAAKVVAKQVSAPAKSVARPVSPARPVSSVSGTAVSAPAAPGVHMPSSAPGLSWYNHGVLSHTGAPAAPSTHAVDSMTHADLIQHAKSLEVRTQSLERDIAAAHQMKDNAERGRKAAETTSVAETHAMTAQHNEELAGLRRQIVELQGQLNTAVEAKAGADEALKSSMEETRRIQAERDTRAEMVGRTCETRIANEVGALKTQLEESERLVQQLHASKTVEMQTLRDSLRAAQSEREEAQSKILQLMEQVAQSQKHYQISMASHRNELKREMETQHNEAVMALQSQLEDARNAKLAAQTSLATMKKEMINIKNTLTTVNTARERAERSLHETKMAMESEREILTSKTEQLDARAKLNESNYERVREQLTKAQAQAHASTEQLAARAQDAERAKDMAISKLEVARKAVEECKDTADEHVSDAVREAEDQRRSAEDRARELTADFEASRREHDIMKEELEATREQLRSAHERFNTESVRISEARESMKTEFEEMHGTLLREHDHLQSERDALLASAETSRTKIASLTSQMDRETKGRARAEARRSELEESFRKRVEEMRHSHSEETKRLQDELRESRQSHGSEMEAVVARHESDMADRIRDIKDEKEALQHRLESKGHDVNVIIADHERRATEAEEKADVSARELEEISHSRDRLEETLSRAQAESQATIDRLKAKADEEKQYLSDKISQLERRHAEFVEKDRHAEDELKERLNKAASTAEAKMSREIERRELRIKNLEERLSNAEEAHRKALDASVEEAHKASEARLSLQRARFAGSDTSKMESMHRDIVENEMRARNAEAAAASAGEHVSRLRNKIDMGDEADTSSTDSVVGSDSDEDSEEESEPGPRESKESSDSAHMWKASTKASLNIRQVLSREQELKKKVDLVRSEQSHVRDTIKEIDNDLDDVKQDIEDANEVVDELQDKAKQLTRDAAAYGSELTMSTSIIMTGIDAGEHLGFDAEHPSSAAAAAMAEGEGAAAPSSSAELLSSSVKTGSSAIGSDGADSIRRRLVSCSEAQRVLQGEVDELKDVRSSLEDERNSLLQKVDSLQRAEALLREQIEEHKETAGHCHSDLDRANSRIQEHTSMVDALQREVGDAKAQLRILDHSAVAARSSYLDAETERVSVSKQSVRDFHTLIMEIRNHRAAAVVHRAAQSLYKDFDGSLPAEDSSEVGAAKSKLASIMGIGGSHVEESDEGMDGDSSVSTFPIEDLNVDVKSGDMAALFDVLNYEMMHLVDTVRGDAMQDKDARISKMHRDHMDEHRIISDRYNTLLSSMDRSHEESMRERRSAATRASERSKAAVAAARTQAQSDLAEQMKAIAGMKEDVDANLEAAESRHHRAVTAGDRVVATEDADPELVRARKTHSDLLRSIDADGDIILEETKSAGSARVADAERLYDASKRHHEHEIAAVQRLYRDSRESLVKNHESTDSERLGEFARRMSLATEHGGVAPRVVKALAAHALTEEKEGRFKMSNGVMLCSPDDLECSDPLREALSAMEPGVALMSAKLLMNENNSRLSRTVDRSLTYQSRFDNAAKEEDQLHDELSTLGKTYMSHAETVNRGMSALQSALGKLQSVREESFRSISDSSTDCGKLLERQTGYIDDAIASIRSAIRDQRRASTRRVADSHNSVASSYHLANKI